MFSNDYSGIESRKLNFYGNDPVCLFKYFVTKEDPQHIYVWFTIGLHILCLSIISVSYLTVWRVTVLSSAALTKDTKEENILLKQIKKRNARLQRKVSLIIGTNLICLVPFIMVSILHAAELINANPSYSVFSLFILPINSATNPIILNNFIHQKLKDFGSRILRAVSNHKCRWLRSRRKMIVIPNAQVIEINGQVPQPLTVPNKEPQPLEINGEISSPLPRLNLEPQALETGEEVSQPLPKPNSEAQALRIGKEVSKSSSESNKDPKTLENGKEVSPALSDPNLEAREVKIGEDVPASLPEPDLKAQASKIGEEVSLPFPGPNLKPQAFETGKKVSPPLSDPNLQAQAVKIGKKVSQPFPGPNLLPKALKMGEEPSQPLPEPNQEPKAL